MDNVTATSIDHIIFYWFCSLTIEGGDGDEKDGEIEAVRLGSRLQAKLKEASDEIEAILQRKIQHLNDEAHIVEQDD
jgi:hypothetical protein